MLYMRNAGISGMTTTAQAVDRVLAVCGGREKIADIFHDRSRTKADEARIDTRDPEER